MLYDRNTCMTSKVLTRNFQSVCFWCRYMRNFLVTTTLDRRTFVKLATGVCMLPKVQCFKIKAENLVIIYVSDL